jgi:transcription elongation factor Elf1
MAKIRPLRKSYNFECPNCGHKISVASTADKGVGRCLQCKQFLNLWIDEKSSSKDIPEWKKKILNFKKENESERTEDCGPQEGQTTKEG